MKMKEGQEDDEGTQDLILAMVAPQMLNDWFLFSVKTKIKRMVNAYLNNVYHVFVYVGNT
jgi:hypothetical protein